MGFALGDLVMPMVRKPIMLFDNGKLAGKLDPTHNIRVMGAPCCSFCPGIGEYHTGACEPNKRKQEAFLRRKKALNSGAPNMPSQKPARRPPGKRSGMRAIERLHEGERPARCQGGLGARRARARRRYRNLTPWLPSRVCSWMFRLAGILLRV